MAGTDIILNPDSLNSLNEAKVRRLVEAAERQLSQGTELLGKFDALTAKGATAGYWAWMSNLAGIRVRDLSTWGGHTEPGKIEVLRSATEHLDSAIRRVNQALRGEAIYRPQYTGDYDEPAPMDWRSSMGMSLMIGTDKRGTEGLINRSRILAEAYEPAELAFRALENEIARGKALEAERVRKEKEEAAARVRAAKDDAERKELQEKWKATRGIKWEDRLPGNRDPLGYLRPEPSPPSWGQWASTKFGF